MMKQPPTWKWWKGGTVGYEARLPASQGRGLTLASAPTFPKLIELVFDLMPKGGHFNFVQVATYDDLISERIPFGGG